MPRIRPYERSVRAPGPVDMPQIKAQDISIQGDVLQGTGDLINQAGEILAQRAERSEVSDLHMRMSEKQAEYTNKWQETMRTADPGDPTIVTKFMEDFDKEFEKIGGSVKTFGAENYFKQNGSAMRNHFLTTTMAGQAELAGVKAKNDYTSALNNYSSSLLNDPSSFGLASQAHDKHLDSLVQMGGLSQAAASELKLKGGTELAKATVRGWIRLNPEDAKQQLGAGQWDNYFDADLKKQMFGEADLEIRGREAEAERLRREQERALKEAQTATQNTFLEKLTKNQLSKDDVLRSNLDPFGSGSKEQFIQMMREKSERRLKPDAGTMIALQQRIHLPDGDPKKIVDENELNRYFPSLGVEGLNFLRGEVQGLRTTEGKADAGLKKSLFTAARNALTKSNPLTGFRDPIGDENYARWMAQVNEEIKEGRKAGKSNRQLFDPNSSDYVGKSINTYQRSPEEIIRDIIKQPVSASSEEGLATPNQEAAAAKPKRPSRNEGESTQDYLKRIGL